MRCRVWRLHSTFIGRTVVSKLKTGKVNMMFINSVAQALRRSCHSGNGALLEEFGVVSTSINFP
ncbi:hypothetical protein EDC63_11040 [Sulfurirhabdus autotrophica]|uniref:Uncharacterized protein n=1 Tax=Sulfurirhabdus autotrophica TaxID=1706046 RepID=A0A4R3Y1J6_9PROT|nr:hypothetical protein EDC63_11040 [Sulfurirhabdus autotrophica]